MLYNVLKTAEAISTSDSGGMYFDCQGKYNKNSFDSLQHYTLFGTTVSQEIEFILQMQNFFYAEPDKHLLMQERKERMAAVSLETGNFAKWF